MKVDRPRNYRVRERDASRNLVKENSVAHIVRGESRVRVKVETSTRFWAFKSEKVNNLGFV